MPLGWEKKKEKNALHKWSAYWALDHNGSHLTWTLFSSHSRQLSSSRVTGRLLLLGNA